VFFNRGSHGVVEDASLRKAINMDRDQNESARHRLDEVNQRLLSTEPISADYIRSLISDPRLGVDIQSELFSFVMNPENVARIRPRLTFEDYQLTALTYLKRCIIDDPPEAIAHSRWIACYEFVNYFKWIWQDSSTRDAGAQVAKQWVRELYMQGDAAQRLAIIQGTLEHLFENPSIREFFSDWMVDKPEIRAAYEQASEWSENGGHSPL
jgi:hypothetical protein